MLGLTSSFTCTFALSSTGIDSKLVQRLRFIRIPYSIFPSHDHPALVLMTTKNLIPRRHMWIGVLERCNPLSVEYRQVCDILIFIIEWVEIGTASYAFLSEAAVCSRYFR